MNGIRTFLFHTEHLGNGRTKDIRIQQTDLIPQSCQGNGQVHSHGTLSHTTFTAAHSNDVLHPRQHLSHLRARLRLELRHNLHLHLFWILHLLTMVFDGRLGRLDGRLQERIGIAREFQHHLHLPVLTIALRSSHTGCISHHATLHEVLLCAGIRHCCQRFHNQLGI